MAEKGGTEKKIEWKFNKKSIIDEIYSLFLMLFTSISVILISIFIIERKFEFFWDNLNLFIIILIMLYIFFYLIKKTEIPIFYYINDKKIIYKSGFKVNKILFIDIKKACIDLDKKNIDFYLNDSKSIKLAIDKEDVLKLEKMFSNDKSIELIKWNESPNLN